MSTNCDVTHYKIFTTLLAVTSSPLSLKIPFSTSFNIVL